MARSDHKKVFGGAVGAGTLLAFTLSWFEHHSLVWAVVHAVYSWFYIAYYALTKSGAMSPVDSSPAINTAALLFAVVVAVGAIATAFFPSPRKSEPNQSSQPTPKRG